MKEMNETPFNFWRPRRPAAALKRRIFAQAAGTSTLATRWLWRTLTPTAACLLLAGLMLNSGNDGMRPKMVSAPVFSNQTQVFCDGTGSQTVQNQVANVTFDWTNHSGFNSSMGFTPTTNSSN